MNALRLSLLLLIAGASGYATAADRASSTESPHAQAIRLVMQTRADEIRKLDKDPDWWHDTKDSAWSARRPVGPGIVDSTHYFMVSYAIDGNVVGSWSVNTRTGQVAGPGESLRIE